MPYLSVDDGYHGMEGIRDRDHDMIYPHGGIVRHMGELLDSCPGFFKLPIKIYYSSLNMMHINQNSSLNMTYINHTYKAGRY
jgi:hypothetical protein